MKVLSIFGTRPEAIKMCPVIKELNNRKNIQSVVCLTGQHGEMLDQVMTLFDIQADYNLKIMKKDQTLSMITTDILKGLDNIFETEQPDIVLVHGDTSSSFSAALSAFYHHIPVGHIEAGLRTYNMQSPYPEEFNRQAVDLISDFYFAPTETAKKQLLREGKNEEKIYVTGNTVIDALKTTVSNHYSHDILDWCKGSRMILLTTHRRENIGKPMENIFEAVKRILVSYEDVKIVFPIHKNPKVREIARQYFANNERVKMIEPLDVYDFHNFMAHSFLILTDSGGVQEEAPALGIPVLVMRDTTERPEGIEAGTLKLVGTETENIVKETALLLNNKERYMQMSIAKNPYGDGTASIKIANCLLSYYEKEK